MTRPRRPDPNQPVKLLTTEQVAELMGMSTTWVVRQVRAGSLHRTAVSARQFRFHPADVAAFQQALRETA